MPRQHVPYWQRRESIARAASPSGGTAVSPAGAQPNYAWPTYGWEPYKAPELEKPSWFGSRFGGWLGEQFGAPTPGEQRQADWERYLQQQQAQLVSVAGPMAGGQLSPIQQLQQQRFEADLRRMLQERGQQFASAAGARGQAYSPAASALSQRLQAEMTMRGLAQLSGQQVAQQMQAMQLLASIQQAEMSRISKEKIMASEQEMEKWRILTDLGLTAILNSDELDTIFAGEDIMDYSGAAEAWEQAKKEYDLPEEDSEEPPWGPGAEIPEW